jgi:hypothetical protein
MANQLHPVTGSISNPSTQKTTDANPYGNSSQHHPSSPRKTDPIELRGDSTQAITPTQLLSKNIQSNLDTKYRLPITNKAIPYAEHESPSKFSSLLLNKIKSTLPNPPTDGQHHTLNSLGEKIHQGFKNTQEQLTATGRLTSESQNHLNVAQTFLDRGLRSMDTVKVQHTDTRKATLELTTQDGDKISLHIRDSSHFQASASEHQKNQQSSRAHGLSFSVEGHLSQEEKQAIEELMQQVSDISGAFFNQDFDSALDLASQLQFDNTQIANLSLKLNQKTHTETHIHTHQPNIAKQLALLQETTQGVRDFLQHANEQKVLAHPRDALSEILTQSVRIQEQARQQNQPDFPIRYSREDLLRLLVIDEINKLSHFL